MVRRRKHVEKIADPAANPPQHIPGGSKIDHAKMLPGFRPLKTGWTPERLQRFFNVLTRTGCVLDACRVAGISDTSAYKMKKRFPLFAAAWDDSLERGHRGLIAIAYQRAAEGRETVIIRKGEEFERRITPSDAILGLLLKRDDMAGGSLGKAGREGVITLDEWRAHKRFDERGEKVKIEDPEVSAANFVSKIDQVRARLKQHAIAGGSCPCCRQVLPAGWPPHSMAELVAIGVVDVDEL